MREVFFQSKTASKLSCICNGGSQSMYWRLGELARHIYMRVDGQAVTRTRTNIIYIRGNTRNATAALSRWITDC